MEPEGMVHALEGIKRLLRADGALVDIHPVLEAPLIEVRSGGAIRFAEPYPGYDYEEDLRHAEGSLDRVVQRGLFTIGRSREFDFLTYGSSVAELRDFIAEVGEYDDRPEDEAVIARKAELYARVDAVMRASGEEAEVVSHERGRMTRLVPAE
jgi:hypothetical protein